MVSNIIHDIISASGMISYINISGLLLFNGSCYGLQYVNFNRHVVMVSLKSNREIDISIRDARVKWVREH